MRNDVDTKARELLGIVSMELEALEEQRDRYLAISTKLRNIIQDVNDPLDKTVDQLGAELDAIAID